MTLSLRALAGAVALSVSLLAQAPPPQQPPAAQQPGAQQQPGFQVDQPPAPVRRPPQARSQEEFQAYQAIAAQTDLAQIEKMTDEFTAKFPESELRAPLYQNLQARYYNENDAEKTVESGRKVLAIDPDNTFALVTNATVLAERTRTTDLDKDQRFSEAIRLAETALNKLDTGIPATVPAERLEEAKNFVRFMAHGAIGAVRLAEDKYAEAEKHLRLSTQYSPDPLNTLRLSLVLDKQGKYPEALEAANRALQLAEQTGQAQVADWARQERERLVKLAPGSAPAPGGQANPKPPSPQ